jgi:hypothetical protein
MRMPRIHGFPNAIQRLLTRNGFNQASPYVIAADARFSSPKLPYITVLQWINFNKAIGKQSSCFASEGKRFLGDLFNCETHYSGLLWVGEAIVLRLERGAFFNRLAGEPPPLVEHSGFQALQLAELVFFGDVVDFDDGHGE